MSTKMSRQYRAALIAVVAFAATPVVAMASASQQTNILPGRASPPTGTSPIHTTATSATDLLVDGYGGQDGYTVSVANAGQPTAWSELVTIKPTVEAPTGWIGRQCLTGDGKHVVVAMAPQLDTSHPDLVAHGGIAYSVDIRTKDVTPLLSGVTLAYFSPGCGIASEVALTSFASDADAPTSVEIFDTDTGKETATFVTADELTSAVPVSKTSAIGVIGRELTALAGHSATQLAELTGQGFDVHPVAGGGVALLVGNENTHRADVVTWNPLHGTAALGAGPLTATSLWAGAAGSIGAVGAQPASPSPPDGGQGGQPEAVTWLTAPANTEVAGVSTGLDRLLVAQHGNAGIAVDTGGGHLVPVKRPDAGRGGTSIKPPAATTGGTAAAVGASATLATQFATANTDQPTCAVPRLDIHHQIVQPTPSQVDWAVQMATRSALVQPRSGDPSWQFTQSYTPSQDFPLAVNVPREVMSGVMVAESNWDQASFHAIGGVAADPLVANYYGVSADGTSRDYSNADCGYGLTQQTDGMRIGDTVFSSQEQQEIGLDYAENVAAGTSTLVSKWNELQSLGIVANNGDPSKIENWYFAIWAYNTGVHAPNGSNPYGLGWANNPINPIYPANRSPYLLDSYADAATPADWPYQEQVMGWSWQPLVDNGAQDYAGASSYPALPPMDSFCSLSQNSCDPTNASAPCTRSDYECWWHAPATWADCTNFGCVLTSWTLSVGAGEPQTPTNPFSPPCNVVGPPAPAAGAVIVSDEADGNPSDLHVSLNSGCGTSRNWSNSGTFSLSFGPMAMVDFHQLGAGFDGHMWFSHEVAEGDTADRVTGTWTPTLPSAGSYMIWAFAPSIGATATDAVYSVSDGMGDLLASAPVRQGWASNAWLQVGMYDLSPGASVSLSNDTTASLNDLGFSALAFEPMTSPVLILHGAPGSSGSSSGDDGAAFSGATDFLASRGLSPETEGYYYNDKNMDDFIDYSGDPVNCYGSTLYRGNAGDGEQLAEDGSGRPSHNNRADYRHLAYQLAWRIHDIYGSRNITIWADSGGGLIVRWMLYQLDSPDPTCPYPSLDISNVVTTSTPNDGANKASLACPAFFEDCELEQYSNPVDNPFLATLNGSSVGRDPVASSGTTWTLFASDSQADSVVPSWSALSMGSPSTPYGSMFWMQYENVPGCDTSSSGPCSDYGGAVSYHHGGYKDDPGTAMDATWYYGEPNPILQTNAPHALVAIYYALTGVSGFGGP